MFRRKELKSALNSDSGKIILKYLHEEHIKKSSFSSNPTTMAYNLGQSELAQELITESNLTDRELDNMQSLYEEYDND